MALIEPASYRFAKSLLECLCAQLAANVIADDTLTMPTRCCLRAGSEILMDISDEGVDACCEGEAYVKIISVYPSGQFPVPDEPTANPCQMNRMAIALELGVIRCLPSSPDCTESDYGVRRAMADMQAAYRAACCWGKALQDSSLGGRGTKWFAGSWDTQGPEGLCVWGTMPLFASLRGESCC